MVLVLQGSQLCKGRPRSRRTRCGTARTTWTRRLQASGSHRGRQSHLGAVSRKASGGTRGAPGPEHERGAVDIRGREDRGKPDRRHSRCEGRTGREAGGTETRREDVGRGRVVGEPGSWRGRARRAGRTRGRGGVCRCPEPGPRPPRTLRAELLEAAGAGTDPGRAGHGLLHPPVLSPCGSHTLPGSPGSEGRRGLRGCPRRPGPSLRTWALPAECTQHASPRASFPAGRGHVPGRSRKRGGTGTRLCVFRGAAGDGAPNLSLKTHLARVPGSKWAFVRGPGSQPGTGIPPSAGTR